MKYSEKQIKEAISKSDSYSGMSRNLGIGYFNGKVKKLIVEHIKHDDLSIDHFSHNGGNRKYKRIEKECPICGSIFETKKGHEREKTTCSRGCANTYFRSGENHGNWKQDTYRTTCFEHHDKKCVVCGEDKIVQVHHYDEDSNNNNPENLIPLCPTHHQYWHSRYKGLVFNIIKEYKERFENKSLG